MKSCPKCRTPLKSEMKEIYNGVFAKVTVCPQCEDGPETLDLANGTDMLFLRRAFKAGGSLAVRLPKEIVDTLGISEGSEINFSVQPNGILIKANGHSNGNGNGYAQKQQA
jgi:hypothetical protein